MSRQISLILVAAVFAALFSISVCGQASRTSVSGQEVTGTFRSPFTGKFKGNFNEIKILALGKGKLKVSFDLTYPFIDGTGQMDANVGSLTGVADIAGDVATYSSSDPDEGSCTITIKFVRPGTIKVTQGEDTSNCGFGFNVSADGTYRKVSNLKPKFDD